MEILKYYGEEVYGEWKRNKEYHWDTLNFLGKILFLPILLSGYVLIPVLVLIIPPLMELLWKRERYKL